MELCPVVPVTVVEGAPTFEEYLNTVAIPHGDGWIVERDIYVSSMDAIRLIYETAFADTSARFQDSITSRSTIGCQRNGLDDALTPF